MIDIVCWKWRAHAIYRSQFTAEHVNTLYRMIERNIKIPFRFSCITDDAKGIDDHVRVIKLWDGPMVPVAESKPNCFRRLRMFSREMEETIGPRFVSMDLDCVILGDITPILMRSEDFVIWGHTARNTHYNGSMMMMSAGARAKVWDTFHPVKSWEIIRRRQLIGSDQAWISHTLGPGEAMFGRDDGVFSFRNDIVARRVQHAPPGARIVYFHGRYDPWDAEVKRDYRWVADHYR